MNGQLSENPLTELIREILEKKISGRLQLQLEKVRVAIYFHSGKLDYAACNVKTLRLGHYLVQSGVITEDELRHLGTSTKDLDLARTLTSEKRLSPEQADALQSKQVSDVLRLALLWTEGTWNFDPRSRLDDEVTFNIDVANLLLEAGRRLPLKSTGSRFRNPAELISPGVNPPNIINLLPAEVFLLSRLEGPTALNNLIAVSSLPESDALRVIYSLALVGVIKRAHWKSAFRNVSPESVRAFKEAKVEHVKSTAPIDAIEAFLDRLSAVNSYYDVLSLEPAATTAELKQAYYDLARKYHPDRFRSSPSSLRNRVETAFARITQAYDTLADPGLRAAYDSKLEARARAVKVAESAPKGSSPAGEPQAVTSEATDSTLTSSQRAEIQFKDGFAALELGQRNVAIGLLAAAAHAVPNEPRYRAYYGRALALHESTRRVAEVELQAAVKLDPNNAEFRIMLAELYRDLGFLVRAKSEAERAVAADHNSRKARDLLRSLTKI